MGSYGERLVVGKRGPDAGRRSPAKASNEYNWPKREMVAAFVKSAGPFVGPFWCHVEKPRKQLPWSVCRPELSARSASHQRNTSEKESKKRRDKKSEAQQAKGGQTGGHVRTLTGNAPTMGPGCSSRYVQEVFSVHFLLLQRISEQFYIRSRD